MNTMACSNAVVDIFVCQNTPIKGVLIHIIAIVVGPVVKARAVTGCATLANGARQ
jgi:hypothetical protein